MKAQSSLDNFGSVATTTKSNKLSDEVIDYLIEHDCPSIQEEKQIAEYLACERAMREHRQQKYDEYKKGFIRVGRCK